MGNPCLGLPGGCCVSFLAFFLFLKKQALQIAFVQAGTGGHAVFRGTQAVFNRTSLVCWQLRQEDPCRTWQSLGQSLGIFFCLDYKLLEPFRQLSNSAFSTLTSGRAIALRTAFGKLLSTRLRTGTGSLGPARCYWTDSHHAWPLPAVAMSHGSWSPTIFGEPQILNLWVRTQQAPVSRPEKLTWFSGFFVAYCFADFLLLNQTQPFSICLFFKRQGASFWPRRKINQWKDINANLFRHGGVNI